MKCPSMGQTDQEVEEICIKSSGKSVAESSLCSLTPRLYIFYSLILEPVHKYKAGTRCSGLPGCSLWPRPGAPASSSSTRYSLGNVTREPLRATIWKNSRTNNKSFHLLWHTLSPALTNSKHTISCTGAHHKQQYLILYSGNQVHPPVTHLNSPCIWGYSRTKNTSPHTSWEVNVCYLTLRGRVIHLYNLFILPNAPLRSIKPLFLYDPNGKYQQFSNSTTARTLLKSVAIIKGVTQSQTGS